MNFCIFNLFFLLTFRAGHRYFGWKSHTISVRLFTRLRRVSV